MPVEFNLITFSITKCISLLNIMFITQREGLLVLSPFQKRFLSRKKPLLLFNHNVTVSLVKSFGDVNHAKKYSRVWNSLTSIRNPKIIRRVRKITWRHIQVLQSRPSLITSPLTSLIKLCRLFNSLVATKVVCNRKKTVSIILSQRETLQPKIKMIKMTPSSLLRLLWILFVSVSSVTRRWME